MNETAKLLRSRLHRARGAALSGTGYRVVSHSQFSGTTSPSFLYDLGPSLSETGTRFTPPKGPRGLYLAGSHQTAGAEYADGILRWQAGFPGQHLIFSVTYSLKNVLDLTVADFRKTLLLRKRDLAAAWLGAHELPPDEWPVTWMLGQTAFDLGFDAIRFHSTKDPKGTCLLIFTDRLVSGSTFAKIHDPNRPDQIMESLP